jgi:small subunit ribosomal protein S6
MAVKTNSVYRATFLLDTRGVEKSIESLYEEITKTLEGLGCDVSKVNNYGTRPMTRLSHNTGQSDAVYVQFEFAASGADQNKIQEKFRLDKRVDRIIIEKI